MRGCGFRGLYPPAGNLFGASRRVLYYARQVERLQSSSDVSFAGPSRTSAWVVADWLFSRGPVSGFGGPKLDPEEKPLGGLSRRCREAPAAGFSSRLLFGPPKAQKGSLGRKASRQRRRQTKQSSALARKQQGERTYPEGASARNTPKPPGKAEAFTGTH